MEGAANRNGPKGFSMLRKVFSALALLAASTLAANAAGDAKAGQDVFKRCAICHTTEKGGGDGLGPNLAGILGHKAAQRPGFAYSPALAKSGLTWNETNLVKWVAGPQRLVPGNKMMFPGLTSKKQQADVVAYLASLK
jgi:cytochrome c